MIDISTLAEIEMLGIQLTELNINGVSVWSGGELPYIPVACIEAVGNCRIHTNVLMTDNPTVTLTIQQNKPEGLLAHGYYSSTQGQWIKSTSTGVLTLDNHWFNYLPSSDATLKQTLTHVVNNDIVTLSSNIIEGEVSVNSNRVSQDFKFFALRPDSYSIYGHGLLFDSTITLEGSLVRDYIPCIYNGEVGLWDKVNATFTGNDTLTDITGVLIVPSEYSAQVMALGIEPEITAEKQLAQLEYMGMEG